MNEALMKSKFQYIDDLVKQPNVETLDYFNIGDAFEAGAEAAEELNEKFINKFLEKIGPFIQGLDAEEIYDMLQLSKEETQK